ncbi:MAG: cysteine desulfurase [Acidimicrobiales bacterium]|nr:cysteine desulfurase [Acidimicrobiales bacterium]
MATYLDHAASTPARPEAVDAMLPYLREEYGNPSGAHGAARRARRAIDDARELVAESLGADPSGVVFTSGGTEADNLAVLGVHDRHGETIVAGATEHHAVLDCVAARSGVFVGVNELGVIDLDQLATVLTELSGRGQKVSLVSVMTVNNEVGTIQPVREVARVVRELAPEAFVHTDAVQAVPWLDLSWLGHEVDLISISAHKFGGPKGVGALVCRPGVDLAARQLGGGQERERRSGTQNVAGIVGMATALSIAQAERQATVERVGKLRDRLADGLVAAVPDALETGIERRADGPDRSGTVAGICHFCFPGIESEALLYLMDKREVFASAASSCASGAMDPSHVLAAMGTPREIAVGSVRLSLGWTSTDADVDAALEVIPAAVERLRVFS